MAVHAGCGWGSEIPTIFKYVTDNGLNLAYHVHSPQAYWDAKREMLRRIHPDWEADDAKIEKEIARMTREFLRSLTSVLSGKENAGKLASGSELLYAFKLFLASDTEIPESTVLEPHNDPRNKFFTIQ